MNPLDTVTTSPHSRNVRGHSSAVPMPLQPQRFMDAAIETDAEPAFRRPVITTCRERVRPTVDRGRNRGIHTLQ